MSEMYPEPSPFGPDGPPQTMIDEGRRVAALDFATRLHAGLARGGRGHALGPDFLAGEVLDTAKKFESYIRGEQ